MHAAARPTAVLAVLMALMGSGALAQGDGGERPFRIPKLDGITIDGKTDDWADRGFRVDLLVDPDEGLRSTKSLAPRARLGWNAQGLLMLLDVRDDVFRESANAERLWEEDGVEVFLATAVGSPDMCQWAIAPGIAPKQPMPRWHLYDYRVDKKLRGRPARPTIARRKTPGGYTMEVLLPLEALAIEPVVGRRFGLQFYVNDLDGGQGDRCNATWYPAKGTHAHSDRMHRCELANEASPPYVAQAALAYNLKELTAQVRITARGDLAGKTVQIVSKPEGKVVGSGRLKAAVPGYVTAQVPMRANDIRRALVARVDGKELCHLPRQSLPTVDLSRTVMLQLFARGRTTWDVKLGFAEATIASAEHTSTFHGKVEGVAVSNDRRGAAIKANTHWGFANVMVELKGAPKGALSIDVDGQRRVVDLGKAARRASKDELGRGAKLRKVTITAVPGEVACGLAQSVAWSGNRRGAIGMYLGVAQQFKGTEWGAKALMDAAGAYAADCEIAPLGPDAWDNAITLYDRVIADYPKTKHAMQARWAKATATGCWARYGCCFNNQGKRDWRAAVGLYRELYGSCKDSGSKCDALRRIAEIQCNKLDWHDGLATYRRLMKEFPKGVAKSPYWTGRTCGTPDGTAVIDYDLMDFTFPRLMRHATSPAEARKLRDEFVAAAPPLETVRMHSLWVLARRLRELGDEARADEIDARLGRIRDWLVVGPFNNNLGVMEQTVCAPEADFLAGKIELAKAYDVRNNVGETGKGHWVHRTSATVNDIWRGRFRVENSGLYALTHVNTAKARRAQLRIGTSGSVKAWLNRKLAYSGAGLDFSVLDQHIAAVDLKPGRNELFIKLASRTGFCPNTVRLTDPRGVALPGLTYTVPDVPAANEKQSDFLLGKTVLLDNVIRIFRQLEAKSGTPWSERSYVFMQVVCMKAAGFDTNYADIMTVSGFGPSFAYAPGPKDRWQINYFLPDGAHERITHATGFGWEWRNHKDPEDYWQALKKAIAAGKPVHAPYPEELLFVGYREGDRPENRQVKPMAYVFIEPNEWWSWERFSRYVRKESHGGRFGVHTGRVEKLAPRDSALEVLKAMVAIATKDPRKKHDRNAKWGPDGIEAYAADLADMTKSGAEEGKGGFFQGGWRGCHNIYPQMSGRPAAATYLKRVAPLFKEGIRKHILAAAAEYEKATEAWTRFAGQLGRDTERVAKVEHTVAWTTAKYRKAGAAAVRDAAKHERAAIAALKAALGAM